MDDRILSYAEPDAAATAAADGYMNNRKTDQQKCLVHLVRL